MIKVKYEYKDNIASFLVSGHANYATSGKDIVCAAVSTALIMTANLYEKIAGGYNILTLEVREGYFSLKVRIEDDISLAISDNLVYTLTSFADEYPKYISING